MSLTEADVAGDDPAPKTGIAPRFGVRYGDDLRYERHLDRPATRARLLPEPTPDVPKPYRRSPRAPETMAMTANDDHDSIAGWLAEWGECIACLDFARARTLFDSGVVGFGTFSDLLVGIDDLEARQWRAVWPAISAFRFDLDGLWTEMSPDRRLGHLAAGWTSTGAHEDGTPFPRPGRCTVTLRRADPASPWLGTHTHFSLNRGTPAVSHRNPPGSGAEP